MAFSVRLRSRSQKLYKPSLNFRLFLRVDFTPCGRFRLVTTGTLSKDDADGSESVGKKNEFALFQTYLIASIWTPSICQILATFPGVEFLKDFIQVQKEEGKFVVGMSSSSIKRQIRKLHVVAVQWTSKKCTKKRAARAELLI